MGTRASTPAGRRPGGGSGRRRRAAHPGGAKRSPSKRSPTGRPAANRAPAKSSTKRAPAKRRKSAARPARDAAAKRAASARQKPRRLRRWAIVAAVLAVGLIAGYFAWLRDSSLVAVTDVEVSGLGSPDSKRIEAALIDAAEPMSTLNLDREGLEAAVSGFPTVVAVKADPSPPHGLAIEVTERLPAVLVSAQGKSVPAAGDGTLLSGLDLGRQARELPRIDLPKLPGSGVLEGDALAQAAVVGAAPDPLRPLIEELSISRRRGVEVTMRGGIPVRFGDSAQAGAKWAALAAVLADPKLDTLTYVDVRVPERPAVGGAAAPTAQEPPVEPTAPTAPAEEAVVAPEATEPTPAEPGL